MSGQSNGIGLQQGGMQPGMQPPGASYGGGNAQMPPSMGQMPMGQFPPRQAMGGPQGQPFGQPMVDPTSAGGNFAPHGFANYLAQLRGQRQ